MRRYGFTALGALLLACQPLDPNGTDSGNALTLSVEGRGIEAPPSGPHSPPSTLIEPLVDAAWLGLKELRFEYCDGARERTDFVGTHALNLLERTEIGTTPLTEHALCGLRMEVDAGLTDPIENLSIFLSGVTAEGTLFEFASELRDSVRVEDIAGALEAEGENLKVLLSFDLSIWLHGLDIDSGELTNGIVFVDESNNKDLLDVFETNFHESVDLLKDEN
jgi:hypothetical protein